MTQIFPMSSLLACIFLLGNLNKTNEITAMKASGISLPVILRPILISSLIIGCLIFVLNELVVPQFMQKANRVRYEKLEVGKRSDTQSIKNIALYGKGNKMIFVKEFDISNERIKHIIVHAQDDKQNMTYKLTADTINWKNNKWYGNGVVVYKINPEGDFEGTPQIYEKKIIDLDESPLDFINNQWQPQYMSYRQLKNYLKIFLGGSQSAKKRLAVDLHYKTAIPFACIIMIIAGAPFAMVTARGAAMVGIAKGILVALCYVPLVALGLALGKSGVLPAPIAAWFANIILGSIGIYKIIKD